MADALASTYRTSRRVRRWYLTLFFWALDTSLCNSFILYRMNHDKKPIAMRDTALSHLQYRSNIVDALLDKALKLAAREKPSDVEPGAASAAVYGPEIVQEKASVYRTGKLSAEVFSRGKHVPQRDPQRGRCYVCKGLGSAYCADCNRHYCIVTERNCFAKEHDARMEDR
jgi:hypothetical protein